MGVGHLKKAKKASEKAVVKRAKNFERALHLWDKWLDSIANGRKVLRFQQSQPSLEEMRSVAQKALAELGFPPCTFFELYWLCCVFCDYETKGGFTFEKLVLPDWFPLPFGFAVRSLDFKGRRIYPPRVWAEANVQFWRERDPVVRFLPPEMRDEHLEALYPDKDWCILLPKDHPVQQFVKKGRPITTMPSGETLLE